MGPRQAHARRARCSRQDIDAALAFWHAACGRSPFRPKWQSCSEDWIQLAPDESDLARHAVKVAARGLPVKLAARSSFFRLAARSPSAMATPKSLSAMVTATSPAGMVAAKSLASHHFKSKELAATLPRALHKAIPRQLRRMVEHQNANATVKGPTGKRVLLPLMTEQKAGSSTRKCFGPHMSSRAKVIASASSSGTIAAKRASTR